MEKLLTITNIQTAQKLNVFLDGFLQELGHERLVGNYYDTRKPLHREPMLIICCDFNAMLHCNFDLLKVKIDPRLPIRH
jgi:hypothetical protein